MKQFIRGQLATEQMKIRASLSGEHKALRIQAYERLTLFCERINIMSLLMRLNNDEMSTNHLKNAMIVSIQKEFEHNLTQQIYVSSQLWQMVTLLKDNMIAAITQSFIENKQKEKSAFESELIRISTALEGSINSKVKEAIRKEVELYFQ